MFEPLVAINTLGDSLTPLAGAQIRTRCRRRTRCRLASSIPESEKTDLLRSEFLWLNGDRDFLGPKSKVEDPPDGGSKVQGREHRCARASEHAEAAAAGPKVG
jgi:hypothetical protein